jgi:hypothetical protein
MAGVSASRMRYTGRNQSWSATAQPAVASTAGSTAEITPSAAATVPAPTYSVVGMSSRAARR